MFLPLISVTDSGLGTSVRIQHINSETYNINKLHSEVVETYSIFTAVGFYKGINTSSSTEQVIYWAQLII